MGFIRMEKGEIKMKYLASTFSPMMLAEFAHASIIPINFDDVPPAATLTSVVSHEVTAKVLSALLEEPVAFNRVNVVLEDGDWLYCVIPAFRTSEAREFSYEEVANAGVRCFLVEVK
jgi:acyl carrier protein phosphodiesterase